MQRDLDVGAVECALEVAFRRDAINAPRTTPWFAVPAVVVVMLSSHFVMLSRNLLYTAVTRGKRLVVLVTDSRALALSLKQARKGERRSRLRERLRKEI